MAVPGHRRKTRFWSGKQEQVTGSGQSLYRGFHEKARQSRVDSLGLSSASVIKAEDYCLPGRNEGRAGQLEEVWLWTGWVVYQRHTARRVLFDL